MTIARTWSGRVKEGNGPAYQDFLEREMFPEFQRLEGSQGARVYRDTNEPDMYTVVSYWTDLGAIERFAGSDIRTAVVPSEAQGFLLEWDQEVRHVEMVLELATSAQAAHPKQSGSDSE